MLIFIAFVAVFFITGPLIILNTSGYSYSFAKNKLEKTGIISLVSLPIKAEIYVNNKKYPALTPAEIDKLLPGDYRIRVQKVNYLPWEKTLAVSSDRAVFARDIVLMSDQKPELLQDTKIAKSVISKSGEIAYVTTKKTGQELRIFTNTKQNILIDRLAPNLPLPNFEFSPNQNALIIGDGSNFTVASWSNNNVLIKTLSIPDEKIISATWSKDGNEIILETTNGLYLTDANNNPIAIPNSKNITSPQLSSRYIYGIKKSGDKFENLIRYSKIFKTWEDIIQLPNTNLKLFTKYNNYIVLKDTKQTRLLLINPDNLKQFYSYSGNNITFDKKGERALIWSEFEINLINLMDGSQNTVTRIASPVTAVAWHPSQAAIFYSTPTTMIFSELDTRDQQNKYNLGEFQNIDSFQVSENNKTLLITGQNPSGTGIFKQELNWQTTAIW